METLVIWSDESFFMLFPTSGRLYVWITPKEAYSPECLVPTAKHGGGSVMVWTAISCYSIGPIITLHGRITAREYEDRLDNQVHFMIPTLFPNNNEVLQDHSAPIHTAGIVQPWFVEHEGELQHLPWSAQPPDLNIIEPLWSVLETKMRNSFPPPASLKQFADFIQEKLYEIQVETVQNWYESSPRKTAAIEGKGWSNTNVCSICSASIILSSPCVRTIWKISLDSCNYFLM
jgi:hypothetical protein